MWTWLPLFCKKKKKIISFSLTFFAFLCLFWCFSASAWRASLLLFKMAFAKLSGIWEGRNRCLCLLLFFHSLLCSVECLLYLRFNRLMWASIFRITKNSYYHLFTHQYLLKRFVLQYLTTVIPYEKKDVPPSVEDLQVLTKSEYYLYQEGSDFSS